MMQPERRVSRARVRINAQTAHREVTACVDTVDHLNLIIEASYVLASRQETENVSRLSVVAPLERDVSRQAARVVA